MRPFPKDLKTNDKLSSSCTDSQNLFIASRLHEIPHHYTDHRFLCVKSVQPLRRKRLIICVQSYPVFHRDH